ncbi:MAG: HEPN domain-containing protein [Thermodesulfovibrionia bacterium]|nr:HEPN domain-containing protein [Thermodesulfovibrionia bacterium]
MFDKLIQKLKKQGKIKKQKAGIVQIEALLKEAILDLGEAKKISHIAERATYLLAYMAMLKAGRALLLFKGYMPDDGAQHKTVVKFMFHFLGKEFKEIVEHFDRMRRKRNIFTYEIDISISKTEAGSAFETAVKFVNLIKEIIKRENQQAEFGF